MSCLFINVEVVAGCDVLEAATEACDLARRLGVDVAYDFNGVKCNALVGSYNPRKLADECMARMGDESGPLKIAFS